MSEMRLNCFSCQTTLSFVSVVSFREECTKCSADVRVCKNCDHYDAKIYNECKESQADRILEKERSNRCDYFRPKSQGGDLATKTATDLKSAAEALFKKS
jgi:hypothetical protein